MEGRGKGHHIPETRRKKKERLMGKKGERRRKSKGKQVGKRNKTYNTRDSLVVTDLTTNLALAGLSRGERTGSRVSRRVWSYVIDWVEVLGDTSLVETPLILLCVRCVYLVRTFISWEMGRV
jgi:hypothetical protein